MKKKQALFFAIAVLLITVMSIVVGCDTGSGEGSIGCSNLTAGTECSEQSVCNTRFLCLTGQGSDSNCTSECSCQ